MAQAISRLLLTAEGQVRSPVSMCEICGRQNGVCYFPRVLRFSPANILAKVLHTHLHVHVAVTRRTNTRSLGNSRKTKLYRKSMSTG